MQSAPYRETIHPPLWVVVVLHSIFWASLWLYLSFCGDIADGAPKLLWTWDLIFITQCAACVAAQIMFGRLTLSVQDRVLQIRFGLLRMIGKNIPLELIAAAEPVQYRPIQDFLGWGIRRGKFRDTPTAVYSLKGSGGVLLTLKVPIDTLLVRTQQILIGNQDPTRLADSLSQSITA